VAEEGTGLIDFLGLTSCVYTIDFDEVAEVDTYVVVPDTGDAAVSYTAQEVEAGDGEVELITNTGF
jgi:hypothetical protein